MNSYIPLLAVQQRTHRIGYDMPVRDYASGIEATAASNAARARLRQPILLASPASKPASPIDAELPHARGAILAGDAPLNMLTVCHWRFLVALAALRNDCTADEVLGRRKPKNFAAARHEAMWLVARHTSYSILRIARLFGRDHATVFASLKKFPSFKRERVSQYVATPAIPRALTADDTERLRIVAEGYAAGLSTANIAEQICLSRSSVKLIAFRNNIAHPSKPFHVRKAASEHEDAAA